MHFPFLEHLFSNEVASAICWTLFHSLWEGLVFVIITGIVMSLTKKSRPAIRYNLLSFQFLLFILVSVLTFIRELSTRISSNVYLGTINLHGILIQEKIQQRPFFYYGGKQQILNTIAGFISLHASLISTIWFIILSVKAVKIISTVIFTQHIRDHRTYDPSAYWKNKTALLCTQLQISKPVMLLESEIIKLPAVFGHLKPVIFIPLGLLANLPPEQVEATLIHELAHIRRSDYLVNFLQNIAETLFFFNPAVLWISSLIREERENCCDDIAIGQTKDKKQFIQTLISFRELSIYNNSKQVIAFPGNDNRLVNRVKRIVLNKNKTLNPMENIFLATSLVILSFLTISFSQKKQISSSKNSSSVKITDSLPAVGPVKAVLKKPAIISSIAKPELAIPSLPQKAIKDTLPRDKDIEQKPSNISNSPNDLMVLSDIAENMGNSNPGETIIVEYKGTIYKIIKLNGAISKLYVDGEIIANEKISNYSGVINKIDEQVRRMRAEQLIRNKEQEQRNVEQAIKNKEQEQRNAEQAILNKKQEERNAEQAVLNKEQELRNAEQAIRNKEQEERNAEQAILNKEQEQRNIILRSIMDDLVKENIIKDTKSLRSLSLNSEEMLVNGERQSAEVHERYKNKYLKSAEDQYNYHKF